MKKLFYLTIGIFIGALLAATLALANEDPIITIVLNGKEIQNANAIQINNVTYLPVRKISEALNLSVTWDEENQKVILQSKNSGEVNNAPTSPAVTKSTQQDQTQNQQTTQNNTVNQQQSEYEVITNYHDDKYTLDTPPIKYNGNVYFPLSYIVGKFNLHDEYDSSSKILSFRNTNIKIDTTDKTNVIIYMGHTYIRNGIAGNIEISN